MVNYTKIAGMGEYRKKKKPKVKAKKDKSSIKIEEVNPITKAKKVTKKGEPNTLYIEPGNINRPGPTSLARRKDRAVDYDFGFARGPKVDKGIKEVSKALKDSKARGGKVKYNTGGIVNPSFSNKFKG